MRSPTFNLADLWEVLADAGPDAECLVAGDVRHTRRSLDLAANRAGNALAARGVGRGDRVGLCARNRAEVVEALLGCWKIGAVPVNLNWRYTAAELGPLLADAGASAVVVEAAFLRAFEGAADLRVVVVLDGPVDGAGGLPAFAWEDVVGAASPERPAWDERSGDDLQLLYTGGTTGLPKGVMWRHEDYFFACASGGDPTGMQPVLEPGDIAAHATPAYRVDHLVPGQLVHASGQWTTLVALYSGCRAILLTGASYDPAEVISLVERERPGSVGVIGDAVARPLAARVLAEPGEHDLSSVLAVSNGGAPLTPSVRDELGRAFPGAVIRDFYGGSETGAIARQLDGSAGPPATFALDATTAVLDPETLEPVPAGSEALGVLARCGRIPLGYWGDPAATAATFRTDARGVRWALLGDLASVVEEGRAVLHGRGAGCVNTGGEKVFPEEVEAVLRAHPAVADAVVVGLPDERWGEVVAAVVELRAGVPEPSPAALQEHCRGSLAGYKVPRRIVLAPAPRTNLGKSDWAAARRLLEVPAGLVGAPGSVGPVTDIFDIPIHTLDGDEGSLAPYRGSALLLVNVASKCGLTPQYTGLEALHESYAARGFSVLGFPCNQFGGQEPGSADEIKEFCSVTYGVTFPMFEKIDVNGDDRHPIYDILTAVPDGDGEAGDVVWNFEKFLLSADGDVVGRFRPGVAPEDETLVAAVEAALPAAEGS